MSEVAARELSRVTGISCLLLELEKKKWKTGNKNNNSDLGRGVVEEVLLNSGLAAEVAGVMQMLLEERWSKEKSNSNERWSELRRGRNGSRRCECETRRWQEEKNLIGGRWRFCSHLYREYSCKVR